MDLLVALCDIALFIDPNEGILDPPVRRRFVYPYIDVQIGQLRLFLETQYKLAVLYRACE